MRATEERLKTLLADAAAAGDYSELAVLNQVAQELSSLAASVSESIPDSQSGLRPTPGALAARRIPRKYPLFFRRDDQLVRVGWSKKARREYRQAVSWKSVEAVVAAIARAGEGKKPFAVESLQPVMDTEGNEVPIYEIYNVVAWLRAEGLLHKRGRKGYSATAPALLTSQAADRWTSLRETGCLG